MPLAAVAARAAGASVGDSTPILEIVALAVIRFAAHVPVLFAGRVAQEAKTPGHRCLSTESRRLARERRVDDLRCGTVHTRFARAHSPCRIATRPASHCYTPRVALLHPPRRIATPPASHCYTPRVALPHAPCRIATRPASHCYTPRVALPHAPCRIAARPASHCYTPRVALLHTPRRIATHPRRIATRPVSHCYTPRVTLLHPMVLLRLRHGCSQTP
jgi:hypothetical protein